MYLAGGEECTKCKEAMFAVVDCLELTHMLHLTKVTRRFKSYLSHIHTRTAVPSARNDKADCLWTYWCSPAAGIIGASLV